MSNKKIENKTPLKLEPKVKAAPTVSELRAKIEADLKIVQGEIASTDERLKCLQQTFWQLQGSLAALNELDK